jgi:hypothetical protein
MLLRFWFNSRLADSLCDMTDNHLEDIAKEIPSLYAGTKQWVREILARPRQMASVDPTTVTQLLNRLASAHHFDGVASSDSPPILMFHCRDGTASSVRKGGVTFFVWGWPSVFGGCLTITVHGSNGLISRISLDQDAEAFRQLESGRCTALFVTHDRAFAAFDVDFTATSLGKEQFSMHWKDVNTHECVVRDIGGTYWSVVENNTTLRKLIDVQDELSCSWNRSFNKIARSAKATLTELSESRMISEYKTADLSEPMVQFLDAVVGANKSLTKIYEYLSIASKEPSWLVGFLKDFKKLLWDFEQWASTSSAPGFIFASFLHSSSLTNCGQALAWIDGQDGARIRQLDLDPERFEFNAAKEYWARLPASLFIDWGNLIAPHDVPISPETLFSGWGTVKLDADIPTVESSINSLLLEADSSRKWSIPPHALVEFKFGPFAFCEVLEIGHDVYFVLRDHRWQFAICCVNPQTSVWALTAWAGEHGDREDEVYAALKLLLAAILRDFWVVEERESVFSTTSLPRRFAKQKGDENQRIVYLPRVHYKRKPDVSCCVSSLDQERRRQHHVAAHLRRVQEASKNQRLLAELYGFTVPTGYTFVRPHERGHKQMEVIYRSRSALRSLYTAVEQGISTQRPHWFQFERDVYKVMERLGYDVQHVSASRRGDHGIDVYATKITGEEIENWVIQCKCYSQEHKVGPNIIRELIGSLSRYETPTKGTVVTTSSYTSGAIEEANRVGIRLINGSEFLRLLNANK